MTNTLGVDWGEKRIGLAVSRGNFAEPFGFVSSFEELFKVIKQEDIEKVVLGLPEGKHEKRVRELGARIEKELEIPVVLRSEVLTSRQALRKIIEAGKPKKSRAALDAVSAALLLQEHLDEYPIV
uniref:Putative pre-16S rRNA nuclease n=1 Tax=candidate division WWE3 bacterium TaxID=2053526 RepID=A0A831YYY2_UNCKA